MCDYESIEENDIINNDDIHRDRVGENSLLHYSPKHRWYYICQQTPEDVFVFRNTDSTGHRASKSWKLFHETQPRKVPTLMSFFSPRRLPLCRGESHEPVGSKVQYRGTLGGHPIKQTKPLLLAPLPSQSWQDNPLSRRARYRSCSSVLAADESSHGKNTPHGLARCSSGT